MNTRIFAHRQRATTRCHLLHLYPSILCRTCCPLPFTCSHLPPARSLAERKKNHFQFISAPGESDFTENYGRTYRKLSCRHENATRPCTMPVYRNPEHLPSCDNPWVRDAIQFLPKLSLAFFLRLRSTLVYTSLHDFASFLFLHSFVQHLFV